MTALSARKWAAGFSSRIGSTWSVALPKMGRGAGNNTWQNRRSARGPDRGRFNGANIFGRPSPARKIVLSWWVSLIIDRVFELLLGDEPPLGQDRGWKVAGVFNERWLTKFEQMYEKNESSSSTFRYLQIYIVEGYRCNRSIHRILFFEEETHPYGNSIFVQHLDRPSYSMINNLTNIIWVDFYFNIIIRSL